mmetsp:Transcript_5579/g.8286  ORF Transcript_5579/g.8286 Transcript_5579/m.8286 type:complete len:261 (+) Transcript_5579:114-896(+)
MPTIAQTTKEKRLISELFNDEDIKSKKQRVRFDDHVEVLSEEDDDDLDDTEEEEEEEVEFILSIGEDGDFDYTIITTATTASADCQPSQEDIKKPSSPAHQEDDAKITRPASPFAGSDRRLCEELYVPPASSSEDGDCCPCCEGILNDIMMLPSFNNYYHPSSRSSSVTSWQSSLGNNLKIFIPRSSSGEDDTATAGAKSPPRDEYDATLLTPLITPPPTPRRDLSSTDGVMTSEETVICEWPCNLTVDNAITSAMEMPL